MITTALPRILTATASVLLAVSLPVAHPYATLGSSAKTVASKDIHAAEWALDNNHFHADQVAKLSEGAGITVAVLDTGVDAAHPDLTDQVLTGTGFVGDKTDTGKTDVSSDSHGTSVAAIIAGSGHGNNNAGMIGLATKAKILPIRVALDATIEAASVAKGIAYAVDNHAQIITVSLGTTQPDPTIHAAVDYALAHNTIIVAAAGNQGQQGNPPIYPASFPGVISVTGVDETGNFWPLSESGPTATLAAPAANIYSAADNGGYLVGNGTSYAAPYVAAAAALIWSAHPAITAGQVIRQLTATADRHGSSPHDDQYGYGILNPLRALTTPVNNDTGNPLLAPANPPTQTGHGFLLPAIITSGTILIAAIILTLALRRRRKTRAQRQRNPPARPARRVTRQHSQR